MDKAADLLLVLAMLPRLKQFTCHGLTEFSATRWSPSAALPTGTDPDPPLPTEFPLLEEVTVRHAMWDHPTVLAERLLENDGEKARNLGDLTVSLEMPGHAHPWVPVIRVASARLRSLTITMKDVTKRNPHERPRIPRWALEPAKQYSSWHEYVLDAVAQCPGLHFLFLQYLPNTRARHGAHSDYLRILADFFSRRPPPLSTIAHLKLGMVDRREHMVSVTDEQCSRLAMSLTDRHRYPAFRKLSVLVMVQVWEEHQEMWSVFRTSKEEVERMRDPLVARWRSAFFLFEGGEDVELDVEAVGYSRSG
ncbi:hypothetical protein C8Q77DRAFT_474470 [Trametes polyzona]|nr:hypothetical protein C8Q77DRAFT_474470 [Trametes polyzona]